MNRIGALTTKLKDRIQPFVEAKDPGAENDPETVAFKNKMRKEADDLKIESFGVEILHTIGAYVKSSQQRFIEHLHPDRRECVYHESHIFHEIAEVSWNTRVLVADERTRFHGERREPLICRSL